MCCDFIRILSCVIRVRVININFNIYIKRPLKILNSDIFYLYQILLNCANRDDSINVFIFQTSRKSIDDDKMIETPLRTCINKVHFTSTSKSFVLLLNIRLESCSITSLHFRDTIDPCRIHRKSFCLQTLKRLFSN